LVFSAIVTFSIPAKPVFQALQAGCQSIGSLFGNISDAWKFGQCINGTATSPCDALGGTITP
jgi:hypothetical protein